jgi:hypothetical protein
MSRKSGSMRKLVPGLALLSCSMFAQAAEQWGASTVRSVYPMGNGNFVLQLMTDPPACPATSSPKYLWVSVGENGMTAEGAKALLATALAAMAMDKTIHVAFTDTSTNCYVNRLAVIN